jgi:hypothetical protein
MTSALSILNLNVKIKTLMPLIKTEFLFSCHYNIKKHINKMKILNLFIENLRK